ncbi:MAG: hypothetical protein JRJ87_25075, partial [Deltaproteobacteria bacterium]|nr:hypothetical protein [Deltaproteobacteria bacterium]
MKRLLLAPVVFSLMLMGCSQDTSPSSQTGPPPSAFTESKEVAARLGKQSPLHLAVIKGDAREVERMLS